MKIGPLRERIVIEAKSFTQSASGEPVETWTVFAGNIWAAADPVSISRSAESFEAQKINTTSMIRFRIRYIDGIVTTMRVVWRSKNWNIHEKLDLKSRKRETHLFCSETA